MSTFIIVEMAEDGNEGMVYGLLTTVHDLGFPFARALGNQIYVRDKTFQFVLSFDVTTCTSTVRFRPRTPPPVPPQGAFKPSLSDARNYITDDLHFRHVVAQSFVVSYSFAMAALLLLPLMPNQKAMAQHRKTTWESREVYGWVTVGVVLFAWVYSLTIDFLAMAPSTMCLKIAGGEGCNQSHHTNPTTGDHCPSFL